MNLKIKKIMTYEAILNELSEVGLKDKFTSDFELNVNESLLKNIKETDKIHSTGSLLRLLIQCFDYESEKWGYWKVVLNYFITPIFARNINNLPK